MTNLPQERPLVFNLSTPPSSTRRKITDENFTSLPRTKRTNEISLGENRGGEWRSVERNKSRSSRSVGHFVDETCRNHDSSSPFTNCKGAANMRDWNFAKQPHERSFCERVPPPVKETFGQEFKKETCRSEPPRCATRYEKHGAERVREIVDPRERRETRRWNGCSWNRLYYLPLDVNRRLYRPIFYKFQTSEKK